MSNPTTASIHALPDSPQKRAMLRQLRPAQQATQRAKRGTGKVGQRKAASALESRFLDRWTLLGGPLLEREYRAVPERKWRFDFAHLGARVLIELHGGTFSNGRHVTGIGFAADRLKMNAAQELGWLVVELTAADVTAVEIERLIGVVNERMGKAGE